jgi:ABC-type iron transport system FetAB permease component
MRVDVFKDDGARAVRIEAQDLSKPVAVIPFFGVVAGEVLHAINHGREALQGGHVEGLHEVEGLLRIKQILVHAP